MIAPVDWRQTPADLVGSLVAAEAATWLSLLHWDVRESWDVIEPARQAGLLPGCVTFDDAGHASGWCAFVCHRDSVQVMTLVAEERGVTDALVEYILNSSQAQTARTAIVCVRATAPGLEELLAKAGFSVERYCYLETRLGPADTASCELAPWPGGVEDAVSLFMRAYAGETTIRAFAPDGSPEAWLEYLDSLLRTPGCGWFNDDLSLSVPGSGNRAVDGAILVTDLGPGTVHVAQLAVDPDARRRGVARRLVTGAMERASVYGAERMTLLVSERNEPALALYAGLGFRPVTHFVVASRTLAA